MVSYSLRGVLQESSIFQEEEWFTNAFPAVSSFSFFHVHAINKEAPSLKVEACLPKTEQTENQNRPIKLKQESYLPPLMVAPYHHNLWTVKAPSWQLVWHIFRLPKSESMLIILCMSPLIFFPPSDKKEGRNHGRPSKKKAAKRSEFLVKLKKTKEDEDDLFPLDFSQFIDEWRSLSLSIGALNIHGLMRSRPTTW